MDFVQVARPQQRTEHAIKLGSRRVAMVCLLQINAWFLENRDPESGEYPGFPDDGSRIILNPPPPPPPPAPAAVGKKGAKKAPEKPKAKGKGKGKLSLRVQD